jgi:hypothetical protein
MLRVDMSDFAGKTKFAEYRVFSVGDQKSGYKIRVEEYRGNAGENFSLFQDWAICRHLIFDPSKV